MYTPTSMHYDVLNCYSTNLWQLNITAIVINLIKGGRGWNSLKRIGLEKGLVWINDSPPLPWNPPIPLETPFPWTHHAWTIQCAHRVLIIFPVNSMQKELQLKAKEKRLETLSRKSEVRYSKQTQLILYVCTCAHNRQYFIQECWAM